MKGKYYVTQESGSRKFFPELPATAYFCAGFQSPEDKGLLTAMHLSESGGTVLSPLFYISRPDKPIIVPEFAGKEAREDGFERAEAAIIKTAQAISDTAYGD